MRFSLPFAFACFAVLALSVVGAPFGQTALAEDDVPQPPPVEEGPTEDAPAKDAAKKPRPVVEAPRDPPPLAEPEGTADLDSVTLNNGSVWPGRILRQSDTEIVLERVSKTGGVGRVTFPMADVRLIRRGRPEGARTNDGAPRLLRDEWFLLRSAGSIVGTRQLELWSVTSRGKSGYRLEERLAYFAQGPQLPATRTHRTEEVDEQFLPLLLAYREEGEASDERGGPERYSRNASGRVVKGIWRGSSYRGGTAHKVEVTVPMGARGRLGAREHLLRAPRRVGLHDLSIMEPDSERVISVRAGFTSVTQDPAGRRPGHEFHWEEGTRRFISYFDRGQAVVQEQVGEGIVALPVSKEQADAAAAQASARGETEATGREISLAEAGIAFMPPGPLWGWAAKNSSPTQTGWRLLGRLSNKVLLSDVRVEWHPDGPASAKGEARVEAWLLRRLRAVCPDLELLEPRRELTGLVGAWRVDLRGTLRKESVRTAVVVVDRPGGRVVLLLASPAGAWEQVRPAIARFVRSVRLL